MPATAWKEVVIDGKVALRVALRELPVCESPEDLLLRVFFTVWVGDGSGQIAWHCFLGVWLASCLLLPDPLFCDPKPGFLVLSICALPFAICRLDICCVCHG